MRIYVYVYVMCIFICECGGVVYKGKKSCGEGRKK